MPIITTCIDLTWVSISSFCLLVSIRSLDTQMWAQVPYAPDSSPPSPRYGHTGVVFGTNMYIFGGFDKDGFACNELFEYSFGKRMRLASCHFFFYVSLVDTSRWRLLKPQGGVTPRDAYYHTAVVYQVRNLAVPYHTETQHSLQGSMFVFGGYKHDLNQLWEYRFGACVAFIVIIGHRQ